jgi:replication-associated recombination protein RarA
MTPENSSSHTIWTEKYRPSTLENYIGGDTLTAKLAEYIQTQDIPHLLFYGTAGTGKCLDESEMIDIEMDLSADELKMLENYIILE